MPSKVGYRAGVPQQPFTKWDAHKDEVEVDYKQMDDSAKTGSWFSGTKGTLIKVLIVVTLFLLGVIIGFAVHRNVHHSEIHHGDHSSSAYKGYSDQLSDKLSGKILASNIEQYLKSYTASVHITGTSGNNRLGKKLMQQLQQFDLEVNEATYQVLLSYPDWQKPGYVSLLNASGTEMLHTAYDGPAQRDHPDITVRYNAFAPNGTVEGDIIYANYGEETDFAKLKQEGVSCKDKIVIMKYGRIFRGLKVKNAEACGAIGAILYSDPSDVTGLHQTEIDVYPNMWFLPGWAAQDGSILPEIYGDPLTPGLPSTKLMYRIHQNEAMLPKIPVHPIGWGQAEQIMKFMSGAGGGNGFRGNLGPNVTYKIGPGYSEPRQGWKVHLEVNNELEQRTIHNIIGTIRGDVEPDRYIILGCHYDAWTFGGVDPNSGTAVLTEVARAFSELVKSGWKPHRTLIFAHFDAEEQGLMGSYEWVEEHEKELSERTVLFLNLDGAVRGNWSLNIQASALLQDVLFDVMKKFPSARSSKQSVYEEWKTSLPPGAGRTLPSITGGSDHAPFVFILGVPAMWPRYYHDLREHQSVSYPAYHSSIDTFDYVKRFVDPHFKAHQVLAKVVSELILQLCTSAKLPYNIVPFATLLDNLYGQLKTAMFDELTETSVVRSSADQYLEQLEYAVGNFSIIAAEFQNRFADIDEKNLLEVRQYNDRLLRVQQAFIYSPGLPDRPMFRNLLFAPSAVDSSGGVTLTGIHDAFKLYSNSLTSVNKPEQDSLWAEVERQVSVLTVAVDAATSILHQGILVRTVL